MLSYTVRKSQIELEVPENIELKTNKENLFKKKLFIVVGMSISFLRVQYSAETIYIRNLFIYTNQ